MSQKNLTSTVIGERLDKVLEEFSRKSPLAGRCDGMNALGEFVAPSDSTVEQDQEALPYGGLPRAPRHEIIRESPRHRWVLMLSLQGYTRQEIATTTGYGVAQVGTILGQEWALDYMAKIQSQTTSQRVMELLDTVAAPAVVRLAIEMNNEKARSGERSTAADKLLDRLFGKAVQPIVHSQKLNPSEMSDAEIEKRLAELKATQANRS